MAPAAGASQTIEIVLNSIALITPLNVEMFLKGGILMGLAYDSPRQTSDSEPLAGNHLACGLQRKPFNHYTDKFNMLC